MSETNPSIAVSQEGSVLTVTLNRPDHHNAMNPELIAGLTSIFRELPSRDDVRVVVSVLRW